MPFAAPGDSLRFYDRHGALLDEASVVSVTPRKDYAEPSLGAIDSRVFSKRESAVYYQIALDHTINGEPCGMVANPGATGSGFVIRNSTFRNNRGHGLFIRANDGLIEDCTLEGTAMAGIVVAPEMTSWNEADYARNVTIRRNTVRNVGIATQCWNSGITVAAFEYGGFAPLPGGHRNIVISDNVLEGNRGVNIAMTSTIGAEISGNRFVNPMTEPAFRLEKSGISNDRALIWLRSTKGLVLKNNSVTRPGVYFSAQVDADSSVQAEGLESAFSPVVGSSEK